MENNISTDINTKNCNGCGWCIAVCPSNALSLLNGKAVVTGDASMSCGHCAAACPENAITIKDLDQDLLEFNSFKVDDKWLPHGRFRIEELVRLMASRRSCRNYKADPIDSGILEDLIKIGITAPSGTNSQCWTFTVLPTRSDLLDLGQQIFLFFKRTNRLARKKYLRMFLKCLGHPTLDNYYRDHFETVEKGLREWEECGRDRLFHGATAAILVGSKPGGSCPAEDALLATQNILLAAHAMGLGTCLIGFAVTVLQKDRRIKRYVGIPEKEAVHAVIALGYPDETYRRFAGRKKITPRFVTADLHPAIP